MAFLEEQVTSLGAEMEAAAAQAEAALKAAQEQAAAQLAAAAADREAALAEAAAHLAAAQVHTRTLLSQQLYTHWRHLYTASSGMSVTLSHTQCRTFTSWVADGHAMLTIIA